MRKALISGPWMSRYYDGCFFVNGTYTYSSNRMVGTLCGNGPDAVHSDFLARIVNPSSETQSKLRSIGKDDIERIAASVLDQIEYGEGAVDLRAVCDWQHNERGLSVSHEPGNAPDERTLGTLSFDPIQIRIFGHPRDPRNRFTLAHELAHLLLDHGEFLRAERTEGRDLEPNSYKLVRFEDLRWMEWQANFFASSLLLPLASFSERFMQVAAQSNWLIVALDSTVR